MKFLCVCYSTERCFSNPTPSSPSAVVSLYRSCPTFIPLMWWARNSTAHKPLHTPSNAQQKHLNITNSFLSASCYAEGYSVRHAWNVKNLPLFIVLEERHYWLLQTFFSHNFTMTETFCSKYSLLVTHNALLMVETVDNIIKPKWIVLLKNKKNFMWNAK